LKFDPDEGCGTRVSKLRGERPGIPALWFRPLYALCSPLWICYVVDIYDGYRILFFGPKGENGENICCIFAPVAELTHDF
jgi:hypothetical protein